MEINKIKNVLIVKVFIYVYDATLQKYSLVPSIHNGLVTRTYDD